MLKEEDNMGIKLVLNVLFGLVVEEILELVATVTRHLQIVVM